MEFRKILPDEINDVKELSNIVIANLERADFFMPFSDKEYQNFCDETQIIAYGAFDGNKLVGTAQLFIADCYVSESKQKLNLSNIKLAGLGGYLVLPEYRNQGIAKQLENILINLAKQLDYDYIEATAHPDNIYSNSAIKAIGAELMLVYTTSNGYLRNLYLLDLKKIN